MPHKKSPQKAPSPRRLFKQPSLPYIVLDNSTKILHLNQAFCTLLKGEKPDFIGSDFLQFIAPKDKVRFLKQYKQFLASGVFPLKAFTIINREGLTTTVDIEGITKKEAELSLTESHLIINNFQPITPEMEEIFQSIGQSIVILDLNCNIIKANNATYRMFNLKEEDSIGKKCSEIFHNICKRHPLCPLEKMFSTNSMQSSEMEIEALGGYFLISVTPILNEKGEITNIIHVVTNVTERHKMELELRDSEEKLRHLYDNTTIGFYRTTPEGKIEFANKALVGMLGFTSLTELQNRNLETEGFKPSYPRAEFKEIMEKSDEVRGLEAAWVRTNGSTLHIRESARAFRDVEGRVIFYEGTVEDITEAKKAQIALKENREFLYLVLNSFPSQMTVIDQDGKIIMVNDAWIKYAITNDLKIPRYGLGSNYLEIIQSAKGAFQNYAQEALKGLKSLLKGETDTFMMEYPAHNPSQRKWFNLLARRFYHNNYNMAIVSHIDISEVKNSEEALRESEERFRNIIAGAEAGYFFVDKDIIIRNVNQAWLKMHKYDSAEEVIGRHAAMTILPEDLEQAQQRVDMMIRGNKLPSGEFRRLCKDGSIGYNLYSACPVVKNGKLIGFEGFFIDTTALKKAGEESKELEVKIQQLEKLESLSLMAGGIAHDFNNMLTGILGNASLALMEVDKDSGVFESLRAIESIAFRASDLTYKMLSFSGKSRFHLQSIDLIKIIESQVQIFKSTISEAITIQIEIPSELPEILADMGQIRHLLMSLLNNAAEAIGAISGGITIRAGVTQLDKAFLTRTIVDDDLPEGTYIFIVITDNGCGISEVNIKKIFDPFYSTKFTGRGLGLSSVLGIVRGHKGAIKVESQLDKGSTFSVYFPC